ncbi:threonine/serine exporter family protein (plasmid) [Sinorhizobium numidicum]|uniref:Threonine/serine exporter family protein n=2 Tax=Sinorhizobium TaxID=28105 RepID=A0ABY8DLN9_9HYPH|nr:MULTISPECIES: threonine/serine exporter family protein [Sinorhizobium]WEX79466.1 threonine/serine exporter family protein [Sinorhizobium numidicum]WEX85578.1 threonine/serine exporter family protein [Sinorhizobium numidicum]WEX91805.1 threonine/serine exporter family protein [Sinorhizobium garamanticum]
MTAIVEAASQPTLLTRAAALDTVALAAKLLFKNGQTSERVVLAVERLGHALGLPLTLHLYWGELVLQVEGTPFSEMVAAMPLGVDMGKVLAVMTVVDGVCDGTLSAEAAHSALEAAGRRPPASTLRFALFAAVGAASLGVIFGALSAASLLLIAASAGIGALARRELAGLGDNPLIQPFCAAVIAGVGGAAAVQFQLSETQVLVAFCPCMVLVPGPHILNGAIDLARVRIALGIARLAYAALIVLMISAGLLAGLAACDATLPAAGPSVAVPLAADVIAAGVAVAGFGTFLSMPWRLLPFPIAVGMLAHAARWALISLAGAHVASGTLVACILVGIIVTPVADRLHLPFAALAFSAVVSMMPGFFLFSAASSLVELVSIGPHAPVDLLIGIVTNGATAFLIILAMTFGLILPRMLFARFRSLARGSSHP